MAGIKAEQQDKDRREGWRYLKGAASHYQLLFHICAVFFGNWGSVEPSLKQKGTASW